MKKVDLFKKLNDLKKESNAKIKAELNILLINGDISGFSTFPDGINVYGFEDDEVIFEYDF